MKNLKELENKDEIKEILVTTETSKRQRQPKNIKEYSPLLHSEKAQHEELPNAIINDAKYVI